LAFAGTLNLLTHFTHHLSQLYIFVFVNNHIILHHHHVRQLLLLLITAQYYYRRITRTFM